VAYRADEAFIVGVMSVFRTYAANGKQYIAVLTAMGMMSGGLMDRAGIKPNRT